jgi:hypothetical protein
LSGQRTRRGDVAAEDTILLKLPNDVRETHSSFFSSCSIWLTHQRSSLIVHPQVSARLHPKYFAQAAKLTSQSVGAVPRMLGNGVRISGVIAEKDAVKELNALQIVGECEFFDQQRRLTRYGCDQMNGLVVAGVFLQALHVTRGGFAQMDFVQH